MKKIVFSLIFPILSSPVLAAGFDEELLKQNMQSSFNKAQISAGIKEEGGTLSSEQRWTGIPKLEMAKKYVKAMKNMGVDVEKDSLYVFVSFDMPDKLIQQYLKDSVASGATVVLKGLPPDVKDLGEFFIRYLKKFRDKNNINPNMQIDPRLFDVYQVERVPTIVYSNRASKDLCTDIYVEETRFREMDLPLQKCQVEPEDSYIKMSGSVPVKYALEEFIKEGVDAGQRLDALKQWYSLSEKKRSEKAKESWSGWGEFDEEGVLKPYEFDVGTPYFLNQKTYIK